MTEKYESRHWVICVVIWKDFKYGFEWKKDYANAYKLYSLADYWIKTLKERTERISVRKCLKPNL